MNIPLLNVDSIMRKSKQSAGPSQNKEENTGGSLPIKKRTKSGTIGAVGYRWPNA